MQKENEQTPQVPRATVNNTRYERPEIRIRGISREKKTEINNIAGWLGVTENDFMKQQLNKIIESFPEHYRTPKPNK